jgi:transposase
MPRPAPPVTLVPEQSRELFTLTSRRTTSQGLALRARIVLACAEGRQNKQVARDLGVDPSTVGKWRRRFIEKGSDGLYDEPRPGTPRKITDERVEAVIIRTLESTPRNATHWSSRMMARQSGISTSSVQRIWRAFGLQPHRTETFKLSTDPLFIDKVRDIVGLYLNPPQRAVVLCVDEKSQVQALDRSQPVLPLRPGSFFVVGDLVMGVNRHRSGNNRLVSLSSGLESLERKLDRYAFNRCQQHHQVSFPPST